MTNRIPLKAKYTGSDTTSLGEFESTDTIDNSYLNTGTAASQLVVLDASARLPAISGANLTDLPATGATTAQANAITANTAKVTNSTSATDLTSGTLADARFPATLPAVDGSLLTGISSGGASDINGLTDGYNVGNSVGLGTDALANDDGTYNRNTAVGSNALTTNTTGPYNTAIGWSALKLNTTGTANTATGYGTLINNTTGGYNTANGLMSSFANTTGGHNTASGTYALKFNTTGGHNTANGDTALHSNTTASYNTASGAYALRLNTTGTKNVGLGYGAGDAITTGSNNTIIGDYAGTTTLADTVVIAAGTTERLKIDASGIQVNGAALAAGATSIDGLTDGYNDASSVGLGTNALANDDGTTNKNTAVGTDALKHNTTGSQNSANGYKALNNNTTGGNNNANGYTALASNTIGSYNTATGSFALASNTTGNRNTATGVFALGNSNGSQNTASGFYALMYNTGSRNTASGYKALENNTYGTRNIGIGNGAGDAITTGSNNTVIGDLAGTTAMASTVLIAAGTTERLKVDSTGLYVNGSATALAGGWTEISSQTITGTPTSITFGSLDLSAYRVVRLEFYSVKRSNNLYTYLKTSNDGFTTLDSWNSATVVALDNTTTSYYRADGSYQDILYFAPHNQWNLITYGVSGYIDFIVNGPVVLVNGLASTYDDGETQALYTGVIDDTTFTDLKIESYSGTWVSGTFKLVGMA